ncbi:beta-carotene hydroxylase [Tamilnaduibacter salinus]|uniref:Beta-carotene hydroxylase n=1 Tax=Tamilnaduibacter salinus TaxID=1484056 RepID=A0A2U1CYI0_9GAMM|nr:fatty acid desaturase [Tamilnaduibacter salinus]PVY77548.1 beta-carotene hydroxylase [Tamilnaduibacter salinus]
MEPDLRHLNQQAIDQSKAYWGDVALGTVMVTGVVTLAFVANLFAWATGLLPLWLATVLLGALTYLAYTPLHEAAHGNIRGREVRFRWLEDVCGYLAAQITLLPHATHRIEHMAHHRHTNDPERDPDYLIHRIGHGEMLRTLLRFLRHLHAHVLTAGTPRVARRDKVRHLTEMVVGVGWRIAFLTQVPVVEGLVLLVVGYLLGVVFTVYWFAYRPHHPYTSQQRYRNTNSFVMPAWMTPVRWFWMGQDLHTIHHLFPRVPFYRYRALFRDIEPILHEQGTPVLGLFSRAPIDPDSVFTTGPTTPTIAGSAAHRSDCRVRRDHLLPGNDPSR